MYNYILEPHQHTPSILYTFWLLEIY